MTKEFSRTERVGDFLHKELGRLIQQEMRDPRLGMTSVTGVEVTRDLAHAKVYVTVLGCESDADAEEPLKVLNGASGFLRSQLAKINRARSTPNLRFYFDASLSRGQYMSRLIDDARRKDGDSEDAAREDD